MTGAFGSVFCDQLDTLLAWRRDVRHFSPEPLADGVVDVLLDRACRAPSVGNSQPWRFVRVVTPALRSAVAASADVANSAAADAYVDPQTRLAYRALKLHGLREAPEHIAVFCDAGAETGAGLGRQTMPETLDYSVVLAIHTLWLAARARGIGLGWVSILDPAEVTRLLDVPPGWRLIGYLCLGLPMVPADIPELATQGWQSRSDLHSTRFIR